jgi:hypothetical protein
MTSSAIRYSAAQASSGAGEVRAVAEEVCLAAADDNEALLAAGAARSTPISIIG